MYNKDSYIHFIWSSYALNLKCAAKANDIMIEYDENQPGFSAPPIPPCIRLVPDSI